MLFTIYGGNLIDPLHIGVVASAVLAIEQKHDLLTEVQAEQQPVVVAFPI